MFVVPPGIVINPQVAVYHHFQNQLDSKLLRLLHRWTSAFRASLQRMISWCKGSDLL